MKITDIHREKRGFCLTSVRFEPEDRKSEKQALVMNRFYEALETAAEQYAGACLAGCALSQYVCCIRGEETEAGILISITLSHRLPGEASRRKSCIHRWERGLLREEKWI